MLMKAAKLLERGFFIFPQNWYSTERSFAFLLITGMSQFGHGIARQQLSLYTCSLLGISTDNANCSSVFVVNCKCQSTGESGGLWYTNKKEQSQIQLHSYFLAKEILTVFVLLPRFE